MLPRLSLTIRLLRCALLPRAAALLPGVYRELAQADWANLERVQVDWMEWCAWRQFAWWKPRRPDEQVDHGDCSVSPADNGSKAGLEASSMSISTPVLLHVFFAKSSEKPRYRQVCRRGVHLWKNSVSTMLLLPLAKSVGTYV